VLTLSRLSRHFYLAKKDLIYRITRMITVHAIDVEGALDNCDMQYLRRASGPLIRDKDYDKDSARARRARSRNS
jgi:hypothetical protein